MPERKIFGRRRPQETPQNPPVLAAPEGLGGPAPLPPRRLRSFAVALTAAGLAALAGLWLTQRNQCEKDDWTGTETNCRSSGSGGGGHLGVFRSFGGGSATTPTAPQGTHFGGFGATGASGLHAGGGHGGGGHGGSGG